jgi:hypothetical protein
MTTEIEIPCAKVLLPKPADLANTFTEVLNIANLLALSGKQDEADKIMEILETVEKALGNYPISVTNPIYPTIEIPEIEWERRITALIEEYHLFPQVKILEIIAKVIPIDFIIPILGLKIDILRIFEDSAYRAELKLEVSEKLDDLDALLPKQLRRYGEDSTLESPEFKAESIWDYIMSQLNQGALKLIYSAAGKLIDMFKEIWDALGLPSLPAILTLDIEEIINEVIEDLQQQLDDAPADLRAEIEGQIIDKLREINIAGFSIIDILGGEPNEYLENPERQKERLITRATNFIEEFPKYLIMEWLEKVKKFLDAIGLGAILDWVTFDFCDFMKLIGMPSTITLDGDFILNGLVTTGAATLGTEGSNVGDSFKSAANTSTAETYQFTTENNKTEYGPTGGSGLVFLDGVKLTTGFTHNASSVTLDSQPTAGLTLLVID